MAENKLKIYDTTLRDGNQARGISFSLADKLLVTQQLDDFGIDYIEGGWPNPTSELDTEFFRRVRSFKLKNSKIAAFASTRRPGKTAENDPILNSLVQCEASVLTIFGKSWNIHVTEVIRTSLEENLEMIRSSVEFLKKYAEEVIYDAEHFFDGYKENPEYALQTLRAAADGGADVLVLCDTNGGMAQSWEFEEIFNKVKAAVQTPLGVHVHNDTGTAVSNSLFAAHNGAVQIQGTVNGYGERCGNANLVTIIPDLSEKMGLQLKCSPNMKNLRQLSLDVDQVLNLDSDIRAPFVGQAAFAHKGGAHIDGVMKVQRSFEQLEPGRVGNAREFIVSDQSGGALIVERLKKIQPSIEKKDPVVAGILATVKKMENKGYHFETADGSFELLARRRLGLFHDEIDVRGYRVIEERRENGLLVSEASVKVEICGRVFHRVAEGDGPVNALDAALRLALAENYPQLAGVELENFKVRVIDGGEGSASRVRVWATFAADTDRWGTAGVSENVIEASWMALLDGLNYKIMKDRTTEDKQ